MILILTHGLVAVLFFVLGRWTVNRVSRTWPDHPHPLEVIMHPHPDESALEQHARKGRESRKIGVIAIVAGTLVVLIGVQAYFDLRERTREDKQTAQAAATQTERLACIDAWGRALTETVEKRSSENTKVARAAKRRDEAIDQVFLLVIAAREIPPQANESDFTRALVEFSESRATLERVRSRAEETRHTNPYPRLVCGGTK